MKLHRKLLSKTMLIYSITFVAGIITGWLIKPSLKKIEHKTDYHNARGAIPWEEWNRGNSSLDDIESEKISTYVSPDVEISGMLDKVLTSDEIKRIYNIYKNRISASLKDTQPIKINKYCCATMRFAIEEKGYIRIINNKYYQLSSLDEKWDKINKCPWCGAYLINI